MQLQVVSTEQKLIPQYKKANKIGVLKVNYESEINEDYKGVKQGKYLEQ